MAIRSIIISLLFTLIVQGEEGRSIESTLSSLANITIPSVDFTEDTSVDEAVHFLNLVLRAPDPPPPKSWKIRLEVSEKSARTKISISGKNLNLHKILGLIADRIGAELVVTTDGFVLREPNNNKQNKSEMATPRKPSD